MTRWIEIAEPHDLSGYLRPLRVAPPPMIPALAHGVRSADGPFTPFARMTDPGGDKVEDGAWRHPDGTMTVACTTAMPGVTAEMWDWWFGWHSLSSARYRLWHPEAHRKSQLALDCRHLPIGRPRYVGNVSAVDEFIGPQMTRLAIAFVPPAEFGLDAAKVDAMGTAVCANVSLRRERMHSSQLVHLIENAADGCVMHSRFHLGELRSQVPLLGPLLTLLLNRPGPRRKLANDGIGLALLQHCYKEMHHLAAILPALHQRFGGE
ncbi:MULTISPECIES: hypothetical protein [unclassified Novosphingobium]|uniref:DAPG hydrolase family protein n=1 Tax=unclassified Novosphingobium TaxID=2644732 RepID=UPI000ED1927E|nr:MULTISPECIES: hypothetical protein [unclassified Novosphingobium]HCF25001.1 hypothetical protein [Novosphingobium sp.]HQV03647.1 hypothetical protein [Novosphingobium sp.]